jgi:AhpD family alkylhydroperoxidase
MKNFKRRIYKNLGEFIADARILFSKRKDLHALMQGEVIAPAFRERIMLAVTSVNQCRYCSYAHSREALSRGIPQEELSQLGQGVFAGSPPNEVPVLLYAQHWAQTNGLPEDLLRNTLISTYGKNTVELMELAMRMIQTGNLLGNTVDFFLYRISFGRWGS